MGVPKRCREIVVPMERRAVKMPAVGVSHRPTMDAGIEGVCMETVQRRAHNLELKDQEYCNWDGRIWLFLKKCVDNLDQGIEKSAGIR